MKEEQIAFPVCICVHDDYWYLAPTIRSFQEAGPVTVFLSRIPWNGESGNWERAREIAIASGAEVILGDWANESAHRQATLHEMKCRGYRQMLIPDSDEVIEDHLLACLIRLAHADVSDLVHVSMRTYWRSPRYVLHPLDPLRPVLMLNPQTVTHRQIREFEGERRLVLGPEYGVLHHLSYAGPDERIARKVSTWSHRDEVVQGWRSNVWNAWPEDKTIRNIHPTHPSVFAFTEQIPLPDPLIDAFDPLPIEPLKETVVPFPKVSVVIPLYGGPEDIRACLESLARFSELIHECVVVDDASPDAAADRVREFPFARLYLNERNKGFAATCNRGLAETSGDIVLFLNSDTIVPRSGFVRLVECLVGSGTIGAAGPFTNASGHFQQIQPTYTNLANLDLFADDFAHRNVDDIETSMLVGFCLAVRRTVLEEVGPFDERFEIGTWEDNDLCYRILRAGYRLTLAARSYIHHAGSRSLRRAEVSPHVHLRVNETKFRRKWAEDLELGFASSLSGMSARPVVFDGARKPERVRENLQRLARRANISLCMIVKDEERVLPDCLRSVRDIFAQVIVVDTGSRDRTVQIACDAGAEVREIAWPDSFAEARNESIRGARGDWIMWMDADDTLPLRSAEVILKAVIDAPANVSAFIIPVQFVEDDDLVGTRVDHVKLFRNVAGLKFEGRIHEQILGSLRTQGGEVARLPAVVLHSGYDKSPEGQRKKRERDWKLLEIDLAERPDHPFVLFNCGMTAHFTDQHERAIEWLRKSVKLAARNESHVRKAYALIALSLKNLGRIEEAQQAISEGLARVGEDAELLFQEAVIFASLGRYEEAIQAYLRMPTDVSGLFTSIDVGILSFKRSFNIASAYMSLDRYKDAKEWWLRSLEQNPRFVSSAEALFEAASREGDLVGMQEACSALRREGPTTKWAETEALYADRTGQGGLPRLKQLTAEEPSALGPKLALARRLLAANDLAAAQRLLDILAREGVPEAAFHLSVLASRRGDFSIALHWMQRAHELDPSHARTNEQLKGLRALVSS